MSPFIMIVEKGSDTVYIGFCELALTHDVTQWRLSSSRTLFPLLFSFTHCKVAPPLTNLITHPLCFLTAFCSDVTSQLFSWERGGALDVKNPDPYYSHCSLCECHERKCASNPNESVLSSQSIVNGMESFDSFVRYRSQDSRTYIGY